MRTQRQRPIGKERSCPPSAHSSSVSSTLHTLTIAASGVKAIASEPASSHAHGQQTSGTVTEGHSRTPAMVRFRPATACMELGAGSTPTASDSPSRKPLAARRSRRCAPCGGRPAEVPSVRERPCLNSDTPQFSVRDADARERRALHDLLRQANRQPSRGPHRGRPGGGHGKSGRSLRVSDRVCTRLSGVVRELCRCVLMKRTSSWCR